MATTISTPVSPKIKWGAIWGVLAGLGSAAVMAAVGALDPHVFDSLGAFGPLIYSAIVAGAATLAGYLAKDKLREIGQATIISASQPNNTVVNGGGTVAPGGTFGDPSTGNPPESLIQ